MAGPRYLAPPEPLVKLPCPGANGRPCAAILRTFATRGGLAAHLNTFHGVTGSESLRLATEVDARVHAAPTAPAPVAIPAAEGGGGAGSAPARETPPAPTPASPAPGEASASRPSIPPPQSGGTRHGTPKAQGPAPEARVMARGGRPGGHAPFPCCGSTGRHRDTCKKRLSLKDAAAPPKAPAGPAATKAKADSLLGQLDAEIAKTTHSLDVLKTAREILVGTRP